MSFLRGVGTAKCSKCCIILNGTAFTDFRYCEDHDPENVAAQAAQIAALTEQRDVEIAALESSRRDSWHKGFCTPACAPGHHSSGCYEGMINDSKARVAALEAEVGRLKATVHLQLTTPSMKEVELEAAVAAWKEAAAQFPTIEGW